jgi:hypothetical protein
VTVAARKKPTKKKPPRPKLKAKKAAPKRRPVAKKTRKAKTSRAKASPMPVPASKDAALAWFGNLSARVTSASALELQTLVAEARTYDLVGLGEVLQNDEQVLELNRAANNLIEAALETVGAASPEGFQLQVLRDIINDS